MAKKVFTDESLNTLVSEIKGYTDTSSAERATKGHGIYYGTCTTAAATAAKVVTLTDETGFSLTTGAVVIIKFTNTNSASSPTLNVNSTGAKSIMVYGTTAASTSSSTNGWAAGAVQIFVYDGTNWVRDYWTNTNTTYSTYSLGIGYGTCTTAAATAAKVVTLTSYSLVKGGIVAVKFTNAVPASATMNINSKGAKNIYYRGAAITANIIKAGDIATFIYDGTQYHLLSIDRWQQDIDEKSTVAFTQSLTSGTKVGTITINDTNTDLYAPTNTDTKNTAGSTDTSSKIYLIGATSQAANPQTYSHNTAYVGTDGCLYSNSTKVSVDGHTHSEYYTKDEVDDRMSLLDDFNDDISNLYNTKADVSHSHSADDIVYESNGWSVTSQLDYLLSEVDVRAYTTDIPKYITTGAKSGTTIGTSATAEGYNTTASGSYSHAEGNTAKATGLGSHAEGYNTTASSNYSHAEGSSTTASGVGSHAEGQSTTASGDYSHAGGYGTVANKYQYAVGRYNANTTAPTSLTDTTQSAGLFIVGIGTSDSARSNGFRVNPAGKVYGTGTFGTSGADYAEYFEWLDGNPNNEDRRGRFVTLEGDKIRYATVNDDYILGVVSADPSVAGDVYSEDWHNRYLKDVFGSKIVEVVEVEETTNEDGEIIPAHTERRWVLNPDYNPDVKYTSREERPEWAAIGIIGKLVVIDDGTCQVNGYCYPNADSIATASQEKTNYRVMERLDDTHIKIFIR